jgi:UDP-N-acetylglucosamine 2-epimerase (non-hydrolysing)
MVEMITKLHKVLNRLKPKIVAVEGDTNSVLAAGIAAIKSKIKLAHVESGLRSYDWRMPEEHNRIAVDHLSDLLFAPTQHARKNLLKENVHGTIHVTGNTVIDAVIQNLPIAKRRSRIKVPQNDFVLVTLHRAENVDDRRTLENFVGALIKAPIQIIFPIHPRTINRLKQFKLYDKVRKADNIKLIPPVGYFDFLILMQKCSFIVTDSGGIQEEVTCPLIRKHVILLRRSTERPEAVEAGFVTVAGTDERKIMDAIKRTIKSRERLTTSSPFGNGNAGKRTARLLSA